MQVERLPERGVHAPSAAKMTPEALFASVCLVAFVAKLIFLFVFAVNTRFVMDEFWQFGQAKYLFDGAFEDFIPGKAIGYWFFFKLAHLIELDAGTMLLAGRIQTALLSCLILGLVFATARSIGQDRLRALATVLLLLCFSTFIERIFRTRAEPLAVFFAASALLLVVQGRGETAARIVMAGFLSGLAFVVTQKSLYFNVALGLALVCNAALQRRLVNGAIQGLVLILGWSSAVAVYCVLVGGSAALGVAEALFLGPIELALNGGSYYQNLWIFIYQTVSRNLLLYLAAIAGIVSIAMRFRRHPEQRRIALIFTVVMTFFVFLHSQPWPYVFVMVLPFLALWIVPVFDGVAGWRWLRVAVIAGFAIVLTVSIQRNIAYLQHDNTGQLNLIAQVEDLVDPQDVYFDGIGMLPNRRDAPRRWLDTRRIGETTKAGEASDVYRAFAAAGPELLIMSYRLAALGEVLGPLIRDSYMTVAPNILLAGRPVGADASSDFRAPVELRYGLYDASGREVGGILMVDGVRRDAPIDLTRGWYRIESTEPARLYLLPHGLDLGPIQPDALARPLFNDVYRF